MAVDGLLVGASEVRLLRFSRCGANPSSPRFEPVQRHPGGRVSGQPDPLEALLLGGLALILGRCVGHPCAGFGCPAAQVGLEFTFERLDIVFSSCWSCNALYAYGARSAGSFALLIAVG